VAVYALAILLLIGGKAVPRVDYLAELNRPAAAAASADSAWPIYREAWIAAGVRNRDWRVLHRDPSDNRAFEYDVHPGDLRWPQAAAYLDTRRPLLDAIRGGSLKPSLGLLAHTRRSDWSERDRLALFGDDPAPPLDAESDSESRLVRVLLPHLAPMTSMAVLTAADMEYAAASKDSGRVLADYRALTGMAGQVAAHPVPADLPDRSPANREDGQPVADAHLPRASRGNTSCAR